VAGTSIRSKRRSCWLARRARWRRCGVYMCLYIQIHMGVRVLTPGDSGGISEGRGGNLRPVVSGCRLVGWASNPPDAGGADGCAAACCGRPADDRSGGCFMSPAVMTVAGPLYVACCGRTLSGSMCEAVAGGLADASAFPFARADSVSASARAASSRANPGRTSFVFFFFLLTTPVPQERKKMHPRDTAKISYHEAKLPTSWLATGDARRRLANRTAINVRQDFRQDESRHRDKIQIPEKQHIHINA